MNRADRAPGRDERLSRGSPASVVNWLAQSNTNGGTAAGGGITLVCTETRPRLRRLRVKLALKYHPFLTFCGNHTVLAHESRKCLLTSPLETVKVLAPIVDPI